MKCIPGAARPRAAVERSTVARAKELHVSWQHDTMCGRSGNIDLSLMQRCWQPVPSLVSRNVASLTIAYRPFNILPRSSARDETVGGDDTPPPCVGEHPISAGPVCAQWSSLFRLRANMRLNPLTQTRKLWKLPLNVLPCSVFSRWRWGGRPFRTSRSVVAFTRQADRRPFYYTLGAPLVNEATRLLDHNLTGLLLFGSGSQVIVELPWDHSLARPALGRKPRSRPLKVGFSFRRHPNSLQPRRQRATGSGRRSGDPLGCLPPLAVHSSQPPTGTPTWCCGTMAREDRAPACAFRFRSKATQAWGPPQSFHHTRIGRQ